MNDIPIYAEVCEDLKVFPQAMKRRSHAQFMRERRQELWVTQAIMRAYGDR